MSSYDYLFKVLLTGDAGAGKSSLLLRLSEDVFSERYVSTIGVDFKVKMVQLCGKTVKLQIWDTAGQERFRTITSSYYRGAHGIIIAYDVTNKESFERVSHWIKEADGHNPHAMKFVIGCKADMHAERTVLHATVCEFAESQGIQCAETSARTGSGVEDAFISISELVLEQQAPHLFPSVILTFSACSARSSESGETFNLTFMKLSGEALDVVVESSSSVTVVAARIREEHALQRVKLLTPSGAAFTSKELVENMAQASSSPDAPKEHTPSASKVMREKVKAAFAKMDVDKSGTLTFEELYDVMVQVSPAVEHEEVQNLLRHMDANRNGVVDLYEFVDWLYDGIVDTSREEMESLLDAMLRVQIGDRVLLKDKEIYLSIGLAASVILQSGQTNCPKGSPRDRQKFQRGEPAVVLSRTTTDLQVRTPDGAEQLVGIEELSRI